MFKKGNKLFSILKNKCPRCQEASFFVDDNPLRFKMHTHCLSCGLDFNQEPGYYVGAMYVSYILGVSLAGFFGISSWYVLAPDILSVVLFTSCMILIAVPFNFRLSRLLWINIWIDYQETPS